MRILIVMTHEHFLLDLLVERYIVLTLQFAGESGFSLFLLNYGQVLVILMEATSFKSKT